MERKTPDVPYTLLELIGKGSFGSVFRAYVKPPLQLFVYITTTNRAAQ